MHINYMDRDIIIFTIAVGLWMIQFILFKDQLKKEDRSGKDGSLTLLQAGFLLCVFTSITFSNLYTGEESILIKKISIVLLIKGIFIRYWAYYVMRQYFTRTIQPHKDRPLISYGPYRFARHPFHVGLFLITLGLCLFICGNVIAVFIVFPVFGSILHYRMSLEEQVLSEKYGDIYQGWCRHRFRLFPFLY
ncbi:isoprenylcysteine carboxylmethyltransferase family protein [Anaerobacillus sp. CMMVII]|uniref:methyltransferase family protein n=1 Tax=Anaerobacillus sp. CMMVII TaxID=2755588 RepID=UPI0021B836CA|nr:isoprenylcysteine carboxylmethyltransferase family protein [Anaerobacillus sp. CMMVII]MCT8137745.1 isoprenylcysteine carboxylmethyltransferase family protein [Anaerobacillus sp. CMMVII]